MDLRSNFSTQRVYGLITGLIAVVLTWYTLILMTNKNGLYTPTVKQYIGLGIATTMGVLAWTKKCLVITPD